MADSSSTRTMSARCHCGTFQASFPIPSSAFPLRGSICHCEDCRFATGMMFGTFAEIPLPPLNPFPGVPHASYEGLKEYRSSSKLTRYFCPRCGANVGCVEGHAWEIATGLIEAVDGEGAIDGVLKREQIFAGSAGDGGAAVWIAKEKYGRRRGHRHTEEVGDDEWTIMTTSMSTDGNTEQLDAECHCGAIKFYVKRPDSERSQPIVKLKTTLCNDSPGRQTSGFETIAWTTVASDSILLPDGRPIDLEDSRLTPYHVSPDVRCFFCKTCGTNVLKKQISPNALTSDIATGLFRGTGARNEDWLEWHLDAHVYMDAAKDKDLAGCIVDGFEAWTIKLSK